MGVINRPLINIVTGFKISSIGIIRISFGDINKKILFFFFKKFFYKKIIPKIINYVYFYDINNIILDKGILLYFNKPHSYTGEDLVEMHLHGNPFILNLILENCKIFLKKYNIKISGRGEFTKRAFYNKKIDIFELRHIYNILNIKKHNLINGKNLLINNIKKNFLEILKILEKIEIISISKEKCKKKLIFYFNYLKKKIFFLISRFNFCLKKKKSIIILGFVNVGKSTFINKLFKNNIFLISNIKGTTRGLSFKNIKINDKIYKVYDTAGFNSNCKNVLEYISILIALKKKKIINYIIYIFDNFIYYNLFFYYTKKEIKKNQFLISIINKIDFFKNKFSLEIYLIKEIIFINLKLSSKKKTGIFFFFNEVKRLDFNKISYFDILIFKALKKCYKIIISIIFIYNIKKRFSFNKFLKLKKIINNITFKKNKGFYNKIFKKFCIGK